MTKQTWGGARPGAGRKKGSVKEGAHGRKKIFQTASISGPPEEIARLKANAQAAGQSVSRYVISMLADLTDVAKQVGQFRGVFYSENELNAYNGEVSDNDYAVVRTVRIVKKEKIEICKQYRWSGTAWIFVREEEFTPCPSAN